MNMKITKAVSRITVSLLCAVLIFTGLPLNAAGPSPEAREAFLRGGNAIAAALTVSESKPAVSKAIEESIPATPPAPKPAPQAKSSAGLSKPMWALLIGGFAASGAIIYWAATGPGASIRNCSTCTK